MPLDKPRKDTQQLPPLILLGSREAGREKKLGVCDFCDFPFRCGGTRSAAQEVRRDRVKIVGLQGETVLDKLVEDDGTWNSLKVPTPAAGLYQMQIFDAKVGFAVKTPTNLPFVLKGRFVSTDLSPKVCFFIPKGLKRAVFYAQGAIPFSLFDPEGVELQEKVNQFVAFDVPPGKDGKVWSLAKFKGGWNPIRALNYPGLFALSSEGMLAPEETVIASAPASP